jgi:serine/threonine protein kinase
MLRLDGRLSTDRAVRVVCQVAGALDAVHTAGLVHRDVKPGNVLVRRIGDEDHAYLTDFGVARPRHSTEALTQSGAVVGTAGYMAPEQIQGAEPTAQSDLYALGCMFFEVISGRPPFTGQNELALLWAHANSPRPVLSSVLPSRDSRFDEFLSVALAVNPAERFVSGREFAKALTGAYEQDRTLTPAPTTIEHVPTRQSVARTQPLTPVPPAQQTPADFPSYGYVTPSPPPGPSYGPPTPAPVTQQRGGNSLAMILLGLVALAGIAVGALAAGGVFSHNSGTASRAAATTQASSTASTSTAKQSTTTGSSASMKQCSGGVSVRADTTSCAFGQNVEQAYLQTSGGTRDVSAYSPATNATYTMHCTGTSPHICTGGNNAEVQFAASPSGSQSSSTSLPAATGALTHCDQNIQAEKSTTSCGFAQNVFVAYWDAYKAHGQQSNTTVNASSPVTKKTYTMTCPSDGTNVVCTGGNNSYVTFPLWAVQVYTGPSS